ncbi:MAG: hypothetical protein JW757_10485 [Anaerolineales bacterium]|nr:hypothetical protein [Anaerolineales bacterium]
MVDRHNFTWVVDISHRWHIDWTQVPETIQLVLIKATEGDYLVDECFQQHVEDALKAGRMVGLTHSYRTRNGGRKVPPKAQADFFLHHTQPYWDDISLRANDFTRGHFLPAAGEFSNPCLGSESEDLFTFHHMLERSDWLAFDLLYTNAATWQEMKLENPDNGYQGPGWIKDQSFINGLWLAWWPYRRPRGPAGLGKFVPGSFSPRLPRPFTQYWAWQFSADFPLRGLYTKDGRVSRSGNLSVIPYPSGIVSQALAAYEQGEAVAMDEWSMAAAYRAGRRDQSDWLTESMRRARDKEGR